MRCPAPVLLLLFLACPATATAEPLNVLFIAVDDLNDWIGCMGGHPQGVSPNLDRLAESGVLFTNAHCAAPACNPSRAALMTGIAPARSGMYINAQQWQQNTLLSQRVTLPQHFRQHGYSATGAGKIYHGGQQHEASWDFFGPIRTGRASNRPPAESYPLNGLGRRTAHFDWGPIDVADEDMHDWHVARWAAGELRKQHDKPFFIACGIYRPHLPWYVPQKYFDEIDLADVQLPEVTADDLDDIPTAGVNMARPTGDHARVTAAGQWQHAVRSYLASIRFADACVGEVLTALREGPNADNTVIVLWSDHGWHLGEKQHWRKFALWEEATQVVLMCHVPGVTQPGGRCDAPVSLLDIYPTLIDVCGLPPRAGLDGESLAPLLRDPTAESDRAVVTTHGRGNHGVRSDRYRLIQYSDGTQELYDHDNDEQEWHNLAEGPKYNEVHQSLVRWLPKVDAEYDPPRRPRGGQ